MQLNVTEYLDMEVTQICMCVSYYSFCRAKVLGIFVWLAENYVGMKGRW